ncbi:hypothetical protein MMC08_002500 [Hypocenomyce scalaris]|nr:hypothetical protein [Hypocenomyce scalaris]
MPESKKDRRRKASRQKRAEKAKPKKGRSFSKSRQKSARRTEGPKGQESVGCVLEREEKLEVGNLGWLTFHTDWLHPLESAPDGLRAQEEKKMSNGLLLQEEQQSPRSLLGSRENPRGDNGGGEKETGKRRPEKESRQRRPEKAKSKNGTDKRAFRGPRMPEARCFNSSFVLLPLPPLPSAPFSSFPLLS